MVGVFSRFSDYVLLKPLQPQEKKLKEQGEEEEEEEEGRDAVSCGSPIDSTDEEELALVVRVDAQEFLPIEHPVEPSDDDRPAKCPLSEYFDNDEEEETFADSLRKRLQSSADGERHQISSARDAAEPSRGSQYNIFHIFQQCKEL